MCLACSSLLVGGTIHRVMVCVLHDSSWCQRHAAGYWPILLSCCGRRQEQVRLLRRAQCW
jgi:hypothetical protein